MATTGKSKAGDAEMAGLVRRWAECVQSGAAEPEQGSAGVDGWLATGLPCSFVYDGRRSADLLPGWRRDVETRDGGEGRTVLAVRYADPATGLVVTWEATTYADQTAVTWLVTYRNEGTADTPILERV